MDQKDEAALKERGKLLFQREKAKRGADATPLEMEAAGAKV